MTEPYVPISEYTAADELLVELEVTTDEASTNTGLITTAVSSALSSKTTAENYISEKFDLLFLAGA